MPPLTFGHNGWATLVAPKQHEAVHTVHINSTGTVTVWHRTSDGWRVAEVQPDGQLGVGQGTTMDAAREDLNRPNAT
jgi:hypothetical protein